MIEVAERSVFVERPVVQLVEHCDSQLLKGTLKGGNIQRRKEAGCSLRVLRQGFALETVCAHCAR